MRSGLNSIIVRSSAIHLIAVFFYYAFGFYFYYQFRLGIIKEENNISVLNHPHTDFILLQAPLDEVIWLDEHEISYCGNRYDVKDVKITNNLFTAFAFHDMEEENLNEQYETSGTNSEKSTSVQKVKTAESYIGSKIIIHHFIICDDLNFKPCEFNYSSGYSAGFFIPPKA